MSIAVLYSSQIRGPNITARLLDSPFTWSGSYSKRSAQAAYSDLVTAADFGQFSGNLTIVLSNDGPKGGAVWHLQLRAIDLALPLQLVDPIGIPGTVTLSGYSTDCIELTVALVWNMQHCEDVVRTVTDSTGTFALELTCRRRRWRQDRTHSSRLTIHWRDVWRTLNTGRTGLAEVARRADVDRCIQELGTKFVLSQDDQSTLADALWWALFNPSKPLDYLIEAGQAGPQLRLGKEYQWVVQSSNDEESLSQIGNAHRVLVKQMHVLRDDRIRSLGIVVCAPD